MRSEGELEDRACRCPRGRIRSHLGLPRGFGKAVGEAMKKTTAKFTRAVTVSIRVVLLLLLVVLIHRTTHAADTVRLAFSSFSATNAGFFTAIEEKFFERRGIDLIHLYIASSAVV